ncbi:MAG TPA: sigma-70 family RNA polymerase sigma factor, partial [Cytophagales bacterium]|nr:sigma-70 family RNA polymerase sigma factor [Cytophagales bacterium]
MEPVIEHLLILIKACKKEDRRSQKELYTAYYSFCMNISIRYTQNNEEAVEVLNDAFLKVFTKGIHSYNVKENTHVGYFKSWLKKIIINTAIDHSRKNNRHYYSQEINETNHPR